jgi:DNA-binding NarL/FixJ family response regulator
MTDSTILTVTGDEKFLTVLRNQIHEQFPGSTRMILAGTIEEACSLLPMAHPRLIVVHWSRHGSQLEDLNRLLWATTVLARQVPVVVIADRYRIDQATTLYRMGVREYISRTHHVDQFGRILDSYLRPSPTPGPLPVASAATKECWMHPSWGTSCSASMSRTVSSGAWCWHSRLAGGLGGEAVKYGGNGRGQKCSRQNSEH